MAPKRKTLTIAGGIAALAVLAGTVAVVLLIEHEDKSPKPECIDPLGPLPPSESPEQTFKAAAISCDAPKCAQIGNDILQKGGKTADAAIATLLCQGIYRSQSMGIGGGFLMVYYNKTQQKSYAIIAREIAPAAATEDMFQGDSYKSQKSALAVAVPGELKGYKWLYDNFGGGVTWADIVQPTIDLCEKGYEVDSHTYAALKEELPYIKEEWRGMREVYLKDQEDNSTFELGDLIRRPQLAETLKIIRDKGADELYTGDLAQVLVEDLESVGGIITVDDMKQYNITAVDPIVVNIAGGYKLHAIPPPGSGILMAFIMRILSTLDIASLVNGRSAMDQVLIYHYIIEACKHAYAKRTYLGDCIGDKDIADQVEQLIKDLTEDEDYLTAVTDLIHANSTNNTYEYYGAEFSQPPEDHGTSHMSIIGPDGDAIACTSTVNLYFGATIRSPRTGIIFNDEMDDFSAPNITNYFGVPPSPNNFIKPGKRPLSSMTPAIFTDKDGNAKLVVGAAGGTRITTATTIVAIRNLWFNETIKEAIDAPRVHHQLWPMEVTYECGVPRGILEGLRKIGHKVSRSTSFSVTCGIERMTNGSLSANADHRKPGSIAGY